jgi:hypothetical protein
MIEKGEKLIADAGEILEGIIPALYTLRTPSCIYGAIPGYHQHASTVWQGPRSDAAHSRVFASVKLFGDICDFP